MSIGLLYVKTGLGYINNPWRPVKKSVEAIAELKKWLNYRQASELAMAGRGDIDEQKNVICAISESAFSCASQ